jgi:hypothetical protein
MVLPVALADEPVSPDYGIWNDYDFPEDRSHWHPTVRHVYDYWAAIAPTGCLPGRQHISPLDLHPFLPRIFLVDVHRAPLRFRYRLVGTEVTWSRRQDPTGQWLDEANPHDLNSLLDRFRYTADIGRPTWRRGHSFWSRDPLHHVVENCLMPLAKDGRTVDMLLGVSIIFDATGREIKTS